MPELKPIPAKPTEPAKPIEPAKQIETFKPIEPAKQIETFKPPTPVIPPLPPKPLNKQRIGEPSKASDAATQPNANETETDLEPQASSNRYRLELGRPRAVELEPDPVLPVQTAAVQPASALLALDHIEFEDLEPMVLSHECESVAKRIPLWVEPCQTACISQDDITLRDGDIVYIRGRSQDYFYTAGLLPGGIVPMPRDHDIDIVEAISLANGSIGGVGGASGIAVIRTGTGPGNILPPTRAIITRKLPNKQQVSIRVDLSQSLRDPKHRPVIQPGDLITLQYKPGEVFGNSVLNLVNLNYTVN